MISLLRSYIQILKHPLNRDKKLVTTLRVLYWKLNQLTAKLPAVMQLNETVRCICYPDSSYGSLIVYTRYPEYYEMKFVEAFLSKNATFIDIGAGFGDYSLVAASVITTGKIIACEPLPAEVKRLQENILLNKFTDRVTVLPVVISDTTGKALFTVHPTAELSHIKPKKAPSKTSQATSSRTTLSIDDLLGKYRCKQVNLAKIDVEGAEFLVIKGAESALKNGVIEAMLIEFNSNQKLFANDKHTNIVQYLRSLGYLTFILTEHGLQRLPRYDENEHKMCSLFVMRKR